MNYMDEKEQKELDYLIQKDIQKIQKEILIYKMKQIEEIKKINKNEIFKPKEKVKISFFKKLIMIINGKKG